MLRKLLKRPIFDPAQLDLTLCDQPIFINTNPRAKHLRLSYDAKNQQLRLTLPPWARPKDIEEFLQKAEPWAKKKTTNIKDVSSIFLNHGSYVPIFGQACQIHFQNDIKSVVKFGSEQIHVTHPKENFLPLLEAGIQKQALKVLSEKSHGFAKQLGVSIVKISVRDTHSRWGSCSVNGNLSYSWRLIFAPLEVAEYVCAHEVAHRKHMNHSAAFWKVVSSVCPTYQQQRQWLRENGKKLFLYRFV